MILRTRVFELCDGRYKNLIELARVMGTSVAMIERHYGALLEGSAASIAARLAKFEAIGS